MQIHFLVPKHLDGKSEYLTEKKSVVEIGTHTQGERERERVENETELTDLKQL